MTAGPFRRVSLSEVAHELGLEPLPPKLLGATHAKPKKPAPPQPATKPALRRDGVIFVRGVGDVDYTTYCSLSFSIEAAPLVDQLRALAAS